MSYLSSILSQASQPFLLTYALIFVTILMAIIFEHKKEAQLSRRGCKQKLEGPVQIPVLGNLYQIAKPGRVKRIHKYLELYFVWYYLEVGRAWLWNRLLIFVFRPEYVELILGNVKLVKKPKEYKILSQSPLGSGLISQVDDSIWRAHRKIITPTFHFHVLKTYIPVFHEETQILMKKIEDKFSTRDEIEMKIMIPDIKPAIQLSAFGMILRNAFGVNIHAQENESHSFISAMSEATEIIQERMAKPWLLVNFFFRIFGYKNRQDVAKKICYDFTESVIRVKRLEYERKQQMTNGTYHHDSCNDKTIRNDSIENNIADETFNNAEINASGCLTNSACSKEERDSHNNPRQDTGIGAKYIGTSHKSFVELIIENEENETEKMSDDEIRDNMVTIMFAGQDTITTTNCFALLMLALHPDIQTKVLNEIDGLFGGPDLDDGHIATYAEIIQLDLLDRVIKETTRLYPAAPIFGRSMTSDLSMGPFILPKGSEIIIFSFGLHRDSKLHQRANQFWPDRFLPENAESMHRFSFIPFGAGSRNCVGQKYAMLQMKIFLSTLLRKYRVSTEECLKTVGDVDELMDIRMTLNIERCPLTLTQRR